MNFISFIIKFIKFKPIIKFKKFELHNYAVWVMDSGCLREPCIRLGSISPMGRGNFEGEQVGPL